jgi:hypothetical protein
MRGAEEPHPLSAMIISTAIRFAAKAPGARHAPVAARSACGITEITTIHVVGGKVAGGKTFLRYPKGTRSNAEMAGGMHTGRMAG